MAKIIEVSHKEVMGKVIAYLAEEKKVELALDEDDYDDQMAVLDIVTGSLEAMAKIAGENKEEGEDVTVKLGDVLELVASFWEGAGEDGNFTLSAIPGAEMKKNVKKAYEE